ncbi:DUF6766 family protein [Lysobacter sp. N42]|uniref:DUF6766 family protein n=1 Tax=Lysobacter sp. N42 TaxID=2545719 RepID=UPI00104B0908|nr:DUF6766 family protein [Lysobacter sp. N42]TCZ88334.1 hypothetical protein EYQ95_13835 [Lysobacter sp. N42]
MATVASRGAVHSGFLARNGLSLAFLALMLLSVLGHALTGWHASNQERQDHGQAPEALTTYLGDGHFLGTLFENWESEFLQMGLFVLLTAFLRQKGASESRPLDPSEEPEPDPVPYAQRPWPVRRGGAWRKAYEHSLSGALLLLFVGSFFAHLYFSWKHHVEQQLQHGEQAVLSMWQYLGGSDFWFESFQNWQSEFLAVVALVLLSIFLREKDSTESKDVEAPHSKTGA